MALTLKNDPYRSSNTNYSCRNPFRRSFPLLYKRYSRVLEAVLKIRVCSATQHNSYDRNSARRSYRNSVQKNLRAVFPTEDPFLDPTKRYLFPHY